MSSISRFANVSFEDIEKLDRNQSLDSISTIRCVRRTVALFRQFLGVENENFEEMSRQELADWLRLFFSSVRKDNGEELKYASFNSLKYGIIKFLKVDLGIDSEKCPEFKQCWATFKAKLKDLKRKGECVQHKMKISKNDMKKLHSSSTNVLKIETPYGLLKKVWWDLLFYLRKSGPDNLHLMTKATFAVGEDSSGQEFVYQTINHSDKENDSMRDAIGECRMYSRPGDPTCPVFSFKSYIAKLHPQIDALWQRPLKKKYRDKKTWYHNAPMGRNTLANMMARISDEAGLSHSYTNHCIRVTSIQALTRAGFDTRYFTRTIGLTSKAASTRKLPRLSDSMQKQIFETLSNEVSCNEENVPIKLRKLHPDFTRFIGLISETATSTIPELSDGKQKHTQKSATLGKSSVSENATEECITIETPELSCSENDKLLHEHDEIIGDKNLSIINLTLSNENASVKSITCNQTQNDHELIHTSQAAPDRATTPNSAATQDTSSSWGTTLDVQRSALRWDIKRTMKGLCNKLGEIGEECFVVTVNVNNGWVGHIGSVRGDEYINAKSHIMYDFLNYCGESVDVDSSSEQTKDSDPSDDETIVEPRIGLEMRMSGDKRPTYNPENILIDLAKHASEIERGYVSDDIGGEVHGDISNNACGDVRGDDSGEKDTTGNKQPPTNITAPTVRQLLQKHASHSTGSNAATSGGMVTSSDVTPETSTGSQLLITDIRTQCPEKTDSKVRGDNETDVTNEKSHPATVDRGLKRKRTNSKIRQQTELDTSESGSWSHVMSMPYSRLVTAELKKPGLTLLNTSTENQSNDRPKRVLRSSNPDKTKKPSLAHLLRRQKVGGDSDSEYSAESEVTDSGDDMLQDDPTDEDWRINKPTHRTSARKK